MPAHNMELATHKSCIVRGFTLVEVLVSTAIFTIVMVIALGALLAMVESDRKAQTIKTVINNLNFALDSMSRTIRTGENYACGSDTTDCRLNPSRYFSFINADRENVAYCVPTSGGSIMRQETTGSLSTSCSTAGGFLPVTSEEVIIEKLSFYLVGVGSGDTIQPKVTILVSGYVKTGKGESSLAACKVAGSKCSIFNLQTSVTQRIYDQ
jgi:prepilin-type N-terminal cleavage/methylation domain-containing protein